MTRKHTNASTAVVPDESVFTHITHTKKRLFLEAYAECGTVRQASHILQAGLVQAGLVQARYLDRIPRRIVTHAECFIRSELGTMPGCSSTAATAHGGLRSVCHVFRRVCHAVAPLLSLSISGADRRRLAG